MRLLVCAVALMLMAPPVAALELTLPVTAREMTSRDTVQDRFFAPVGVFKDGQVPSQMIEGAVARSAWRIQQAGLTPLQFVKPLRAQLAQAGYRIVLDCADRICGGYDFRFEAEVLPAPNMYVNLRNYHVLTALRGPEGTEPTEAVNIIASASNGATFAQIIQAGSAQAQEPDIVVPLPVAAVTGQFAQRLQTEGHAVLDALEFASGTSDLGTGPFPALEELAQNLRAHPRMRVALVGHTDNTGSLAGNIALSRARANAVKARMVAEYAVDPARLEAEGMGYLAPLGSNLTQAGREANRRVEAVLLEQ